MNTFAPKLVLVPTPIDDSIALNSNAQSSLKDSSPNDIILVEEPKTARARWIAWGLPREQISKFVYFNEQTNSLSEQKSLLQKARKNRSNIYLLSDTGLPALDDPGQEFVDLCHKEGIEVTSTAFDNSHLLALILSGFKNKKFTCCGFPPQKSSDRSSWFKHELKNPGTLIILDTPYRFRKTLEEISKQMNALHQSKKRDIFVGTELGSKGQKCYRGKPGELIKLTEHLKKPRFILVISSLE